MSTPSVRLLPFAVADGPTNMAADEVMLFSAERGVASLRLYGWSPPTLSLGYFQPAAARLADPLLAALPWVRRPSGGATLVHDRELTYALALPAGSPWQGGEPWMSRMHAVLARAVAACGVAAAVSPHAGPSRVLGDVLCFQQHTAGDLLADGHKVVGSAQRKHRRCLLQHGSVLLERTPSAAALPGLADVTGVAVTAGQLAGAIEASFRAATGWCLEAGAWTGAERRETASLVRDKYATAAWNEKR